MGLTLPGCCMHACGGAGGENELASAETACPSHLFNRAGNCVGGPAGVCIKSLTASAAVPANLTQPSAAGLAELKGALGAPL